MWQCNRNLIAIHYSARHVSLHTYLLKSLRIGQVWVAWEGHQVGHQVGDQEGVLSGDPWGGGVEQLVLVCEGEENECISKMYCTSLVRRSRRVITRYKHPHTVPHAKYVSWSFVISTDNKKILRCRLLG